MTKMGEILECPKCKLSRLPGLPVMQTCACSWIRLERWLLGQLITAQAELNVALNKIQELTPAEEPTGEMEPEGNPCEHCGQPTPYDGQIYNLGPAHEVGGEPLIYHQRCYEHHEAHEKLKEEHTKLLSHGRLQGHLGEALGEFVPNPNYKGMLPACFVHGHIKCDREGCGTPIPQERSSPLPPDAQKIVDWGKAKACPKCGKGLLADYEPELCPDCLQDRVVNVLGPDLNGFESQDTCWVCDNVPDVVKHAEGSSKPAYRFRLNRIVLEHQGFTGGYGPEDSPYCVHVGEQAHMRSKRHVWVCEPCIEALKIIIKESPALDYTRKRI